MSKKTETVELRLPNRTVMALDQVAELAGTSRQDVVKVMLALCASALIGSGVQKPKGDEGARE